ncbi:MAG: AAA family ATPase [Bacteroidales bacterium]|nr:AAA family ATPase [Bacteroidales bacterium]
MIEELQIKNFKSIKDLKLKCKKLNIFIGNPNSGKSNIVEALALKSQNAIDYNLEQNGQSLSKRIFRYKDINSLFFDNNINRPIEVITDAHETVLEFAIAENGVIENKINFYFDKNSQQNPTKFHFTGLISRDGDNVETNVRYYEYTRFEKFEAAFLPHLNVPNGTNIPGLLISNPENRKWVSDFLKSFGFSLNLNPAENTIVVSKVIDDIIYSYPYQSLSETVQRVIFYILALKTNQNCTLLFDEPETNTFPLYTKFLAESFALDPTNQFFITTHNPYLLENLIQKSKIEDLNVCLIKMENYETQVNVLDEEQISKVLDLSSDVFFNFDNLI